jgi:transcriptional regulator with XRE-family HTH domain
LATAADQARVALGIRLRDIRRDAGLTSTQLAQTLGWLMSKVSKIEHGRQTPSEADLSAWCSACRAANEMPDLVAAVRTIETQFAEWRRILRAGTRRRQEASAQAYDQARLFRIWEPAVLPGLFQTRDYAVAVLSTTVDFFHIPDDAEQGAAARLERQRILTQADRRFHFVIGEQALYTNVGGAEVMADQLERLLELLKLQHVRVGILPARAPYRVPLHNGFWIFDDALVQFDTYTAELSLIRPDEIALYTRAFERLTALALYRAEARAMIAAALTAHQST